MHHNHGGMMMMDEMSTPKMMMAAMDHSTTAAPMSMDHRQHMDHMDHMAQGQAAEMGHSMDHSSHGGAMLFFDEIKNFQVLFEAWTVNHSWEFVITIIGCFVVAFLFEALRIGRQIHCQRFFKSRRANVRKPTPNGSQLSFVATTEDSSANCCNSTAKENAIAINNGGHCLTSFHMVQTLFHLLLVTLSFLIMLIVMSFNVWIFVSVVLGMTASYAILGHFVIHTDMDFIGDDSCCA